MTSTSEERLLFLLKSKGAQTAQDAGEALGITTPGAQQQLARLATNGLVVPEDRKQARGRPKRYWSLTDEGHARFPDSHADLTIELINATRTVFGDEGLDRLIDHRERQTHSRYKSELEGLRSLEERIDRLAKLRSAEGYMAEWLREAEGLYMLVENHCPVCAAATLCQGLCRSELQMFRSLLGPDASVERTDHILAGARRCAYRIEAAAP